MSENPDSLKIPAIVVGANLLILAVYQLALMHVQYRQIASAMYIAGHVIAVVIISAILFRTKYTSWAQAFILSSLFIMLAGLGTCAMF